MKEGRADGAQECEALSSSISLALDGENRRGLYSHMTTRGTVHYRLA